MICFAAILNLKYVPSLKVSQIGLLGPITYLLTKLIADSTIIGCCWRACRPYWIYAN